MMVVGMMQHYHRWGRRSQLRALALVEALAGTSCCCRLWGSSLTVFPFSRGKNRISQGVENRGSLISVPLALREKHRDTDGSHIVTRSGGVCTTFNKEEGKLLRSIAIEM